MPEEHVDFAIITIRDDEFEAVAQRFQLTPKRGAISGRMHNISHIQTRDGQNRIVTVTSCGDPGPQVAQQVASDIIRDFSPSLLLVVGIAGGVPDTDFTLGDVIISSRIHDFNVNAYKSGKIEWDVRGGVHPAVSEIVANLATTYSRWLKGWNSVQSIGMERPTPNANWFKYSDPAKMIKDFDLAKMTKEEKQRIFDGELAESWQQKIMSVLEWHFGDPPQRSPQPIYKTGPIAASGSLVRDFAVLTQWLQDARGIRAIEMESGGVFQAGQQMRLQQYPMMAIRGISDIVGLKRDYRWTPYACHSAAAFTHALLTSDSSIFDNLIRQQPAPGNGTITPPQPPSPQDPASKETPIQVYISYAESDEKFKLELEKHLALLKRYKLISMWHSHQIDVGTVKDKEIESHLDAAQIILLLISQDFIASDDYYEEMVHALQRQASNKVRIIPIIIRPCDWHETPIGKLQGLPRNNKPIATLQDRDQAWLEVTNEIRRVCEDLRKKS